jgi:hypothetical protein
MHERCVHVDQRLSCQSPILSKPCIRPAPNAPTCTPHTPMTPQGISPSLTLPTLPALPHPRARANPQLSNQHYCALHIRLLSLPLSLTAPPLPSTAPAFGLQLPRNNPTTKHPVSLHYSGFIHYRICQHVNPYWPRPAWSVCLTSINNIIHNDNHPFMPNDLPSRSPFIHSILIYHTAHLTPTTYHTCPCPHHHSMTVLRLHRVPPCTTTVIRIPPTSHAHRVVLPRSPNTLSR